MLSFSHFLSLSFSLHPSPFLYVLIFKLANELWTEETVDEIKSAMGTRLNATCIHSPYYERISPFITIISFPELIKSDY